MEVQVALSYTDLISFKYIPRSEITEPCGRPILGFVRILHPVFQNGCTSLHSHQQGISAPLSL